MVLIELVEKASNRARVCGFKQSDTFRIFLTACEAVFQLEWEVYVPAEYKYKDIE